jgi:hypothetical protein
MKKLLFIACSLSLIFASCKKSKDETPAGFQWPEGTGPYAPYTVGSTFVYETQATTPVAIDSFTYTVTKDTTIDGAKYKKIESSKPNLVNGFYCNYSNGIRTEITYNSAIGGITVPTIKQIVLKDNVAVSSNWMETLNISVPIPGSPLPISVPVTFNYTVQQKDFTKNILTKDYAKTIFTKQVASLPNGLPLPPGTPSSITVDNFFADGFGIVERDLPNTAIKIKRANVIK